MACEIGAEQCASRFESCDSDKPARVGVMAARTSQKVEAGTSLYGKEDSVRFVARASKIE